METPAALLLPYREPIKLPDLPGRTLGGVLDPPKKGRELVRPGRAPLALRETLLVVGDQAARVGEGFVQQSLA
jgi:hypothetical protein